MELFFPVWDHERDALMEHRFDRPRLAGMDQVEFENSGADEDSIWVAAEVPEAEAVCQEEPDSNFLGSPLLRLAA
jgi:hypothetical protein